MQPSSEELTPRAAEGGGAYGVRSVGMGGYHTVAASGVCDRWGRPFDERFSGLPRGLQLPAARHAKHDAPDPDAENGPDKIGASDPAGAGGGRAGSGAAKKGEGKPELVGRLRVATSVTNRTEHATLLVAPSILNARRR